MGKWITIVQHCAVLLKCVDTGLTHAYFELHTVCFFFNYCEIHRPLTVPEASRNFCVTLSPDNWPSCKDNSALFECRGRKVNVPCEKVYLQVIISINLWITACWLHTSPLICLIEQRPVLSTVIYFIIRPLPCSSLTSGLVGLTDVILHFRTILFA